MLNKTAFSNSMALATAAFYIIFYVISLGAPTVFQFLFNAQFLGANIAQFEPQGLSLSTFIETLLTIVLITWIFGYAWAWLYNKLAK